MSKKFMPGVGRIESIDKELIGKEDVKLLDPKDFEARFGTAFVQPNDEIREIEIGDEAWSRLPDPVGWRILIRPYSGRSVSKGGTIHLAQSGVAKEALATVVAMVLKVGPIAYADKRKFGDKPWCKEGDWVVVGKYAGARFRLYFDTGDNPEVRMINDDEVIGKVLDPDDVRTL